MTPRLQTLGQANPANHQPGAVYLLPHANRLRFKIGWSLHPLRRVQQLPEYGASQLDLVQAQVAWFHHAHRARQVERALHRSLGPYGVRAGHHGDGHTEWFNIHGLVLARRMLCMLPVARGEQRARLRALADAPEAPREGVPVEPENCAMDAWYRVEDLWLRMASMVPPALATEREQRQLYWLGLRRHHEPGALALRPHALNLETYEWREEGNRCSLVMLMDWEGDDLLLQLTPTRQLKRWAQGDEVDRLMRTFLASKALTWTTPQCRRATALRSVPVPTT